MASLFYRNLPPFGHVHQHQTENCAARSPEFAISIHEEAAARRWFAGCTGKNIPKAIVLFKIMDTLAPKRDRFQTILSLIADCDKEANNYAQEIGKAGDVMRRALEMQIADAEKRYAALTKERNELESLLDARRLTEEAVKTALQFREDAVTGTQDPIFENKRKILELLHTSYSQRPPNQDYLANPGVCE